MARDLTVVYRRKGVVEQASDPCATEAFPKAVTFDGAGDNITAVSIADGNTVGWRLITNTVPSLLFIRDAAGNEFRIPLTAIDFYRVSDAD